MRFATLAEWLSWQQTLHPNAIDLGLARVTSTLRQLGWHRPACPVITVAGTNGKGSSVALLATILAQAGYRVGQFTSPHLIRYNERIVIDGCEASDASLIAAFERIDAARGDQTLTFFEFNALAALLIFETAGLDAIVLEVGMGGRLDAANVVDADVALITSIALDHCEWLGHDFETIGREKAGIFRAGKPAIFGSAAMPESIHAAAVETGAKLLRLGKDFSYSRQRDRWSWRGSGTHLDDLPWPAMVGDIQFDNAAAVLAVLEALSDRLPVSADVIARGLLQTRIAGRFQSVVRDGVEWILDVAHNPAAARTLASQLAERAKAGRTIAVCGILADKDVEGIAAELRGSFDYWIVSGVESERGMEPQRLAQRLGVTSKESATASDVIAACTKAATLARREDTIVVFGSFLTVAPALVWLSDSSPPMP
ncbi:MAG TPA: bifunctional tetrahydrofolate synthase/dihydrofolate synthase [Povalibacter sp.]